MILMVHIKKSPLLLLIVALGLLGVVDYIAANVIEQGYAQDANQVKRHIQLCSLTEAISKLDYDAGVAMGGYSVTKDSLFYSRFQRISAELTKELEELRQLVSSIPEEKAACQSISELSTAILDVNRKAKSMIDEPL